MREEEPMLEVRDIDVYYGDSQAVFGLSLSVHKGEVVTLVGSNSADNTTTLRAISGTSRSRAESSSSRASRC
jgi:branched-chain amino acid transport system ATP-binding protein